MPARRPRVPVGGPPLSDFKLPDLLALLSGWLPPGHPERFHRYANTRWQSWGEYVADARRLHADLRGKFRTGARAGLRPMFAECVVAFVDQFGMDALDRASYQDIRAALPEAPE